jgi:hypothetical protein
MTIAITVLLTLAAALVLGALVRSANNPRSLTMGLEWPWRGMAPDAGRQAMPARVRPSRALRPLALAL